MNNEDLIFFDAIAPEWDSMEIHSLPRKINMVLDHTGLREGMRVLDLGTGTGVLVPYILERTGHNGFLHAVDASAGMLAEAKKKYRHLTTYDIFELKDFEKESIDGTFDMIFLYCVYPHLSTPMETLTRLFQENLAAGGTIIIAFPTGEDFINSIHREKKIESGLLPAPEVLAARLRGHGLESETVDIPDAYMVKITKKHGCEASNN